MTVRGIQKLIYIFLLFLGFAGPVLAEQEFTAPVSDEAEITIEHYPANGNYLVIWIAPEYGLREEHRSLARMLAAQGIEIWMTDLVDSLFLPRSTSSLRNLGGSEVAELVAYAHQQTGKKILLSGDSYASLAVLRGAREWQLRQDKQLYLVGAILFSPYTYSSIPALGQLPQYMPVVSATNIPMVIYQAKNSGIISQFATLLNKLQQHGAPVYTRFTPNVMSLFYEQQQKDEMKKQAQKIPANLKKMIRVLEKHRLPAKVIPLKQEKSASSGIDIYLKKFTGGIKPVAIRLTDTNGNTVTRRNYKGKVTIINFWATWCPPCIEEIPSLNRLKNKMQGREFELISINYAENGTVIRDFMKRVNVEFPVLLDRNGEFAKQWNVISYPSTFVIDKNGLIVYGVNAALEWDSPELIEKITALF